MSESIFRADGGRLAPTGHARGPWDPQALHGGAPAALMARALERTEPSPGMAIARLTFDFLRPIPFAPLSLATRVVRAGRRVQELACELRDGEQPVVRAVALRVRAVPPGMQSSGCPGPAPMPGPEHGSPVRFSLSERTGDSFAATAMEMRWLDDPAALGPARVWMRLRHPLLPGEPATPLARVAAAADFANGVSAELPFSGFLFINADLAIRLHREPAGEWIGLDARTVLQPGGCAVAESVLHDERGPVGRASQTLVVQPR